MAIDCVSRHTAYVHDRGGQSRLFQLLDAAEIRWSRVRDDISEAQVTIAAEYCFAQAEQLDYLRQAVGRLELVIFRGPERVWEGPITLVQITRTQYVIKARDVMHYASRTVMHSGYDNSYPNIGYAVERARLILSNELARKEALNPPINVLAHMVDHQTSTDAKTSRKTLPYQQTVFEQVDDLAAKGGIDYTVIGRAIHIWDTSKPAMGQTPTVTDNDFLGDLTVSVYGMDLITRAVVTDGEGHYGIAGGVDSFYGEVENLATAYDETEGESPPTSAEMASQAQRNLAGSNPTPMLLRVPDNSSLNPNGVLTIDMLVPGVYIPVRANILVGTVQQMQKLQTVTVTETADGETIAVSLYPASDADEEEAE